MMLQSHSQAYIWGKNYNSKWYMHPTVLYSIMHNGRDLDQPNVDWLVKG